MKRPALILVAMLLGCSSTPPSGEKSLVEVDPSRVVEANFAWPDELIGKMTYVQKYEVSTSDADLFDFESTEDYQIEGWFTADGYAVWVIPSKLDDMSAGTEEEQAESAVSAFYESLIPPVSLTKSGEFKALLDPDYEKAGLRVLKQSMAEEEDSELFKTMLENLNLYQIRKRGAELYWVQWVGTWLYRQSYQLGRPYEIPKHLFGEFSGTMQIEASKRVKCLPDDQVKRCVEFTASDEIDPKEALHAFAFLDEFTSVLPLVPLGGQRNYRTVADPETMMPYRHTSYTEATARLELDDESITMTVVRIDEADMTYE